MCKRLVAVFIPNVDPKGGYATAIRGALGKYCIDCLKLGRQSEAYKSVRDSSPDMRGCRRPSLAIAKFGEAYAMGVFTKLLAEKDRAGKKPAHTRPVAPAPTSASTSSKPTKVTVPRPLLVQGEQDNEGTVDLDFTLSTPAEGV
jgi:hypothetical protein